MIMPVNSADCQAGLEHIEYFKAIPWCAAIINDPRHVISPTVTRLPKDNGEDAFFAKTLQTDDTIKRLLTVNSIPDASLDPPIQQIYVFFELGSGVNGYPNTCHGGFVATMLDETMGLVVNLVQVYENSKTGRLDNINHMTAYINTTYLAPVHTPGIILGTATVMKKEGRKLWIKGTLEDKERRVLARSESLFIEAKHDPRTGVKL